MIQLYNKVIPLQYNLHIVILTMAHITLNVRYISNNIQQYMFGIWLIPALSEWNGIIGNNQLHAATAVCKLTKGMLWTQMRLTHWGGVTHMCVSKLTIIGSNNGLSPGWCQANIWPNTGILLVGYLGINFSEISSEIHTFSFTKC